MSGLSPPDKVRALLFDVDGTLIETLADIEASVNHALDQLGLPRRSNNEVRSSVGRGVEYLILKSLGPGREHLLEDALRIFREHYDDHCLDNARLLPGVIDCLDHFTGRNLGIVSNKPERFVRKMLEGLDLARRFGVIFGGDSLDEKKPSPLMVQRALERFGCEPSESALVGDMPVDVETGRAAGVYTVIVLAGTFASREEIDASRPDRIVETLHEIPRVVP